MSCSYRSTQIYKFIFTVTPSPTGTVNRSSLAGVVAAGVLVPVIVLGLLAATTVVMAVICRKGIHRVMF